MFQKKWLIAVACLFIIPATILESRPRRQRRVVKRHHLKTSLKRRKKATPRLRRRRGFSTRVKSHRQNGKRRKKITRKRRFRLRKQVVRRLQRRRRRSASKKRGSRRNRRRHNAKKRSRSNRNNRHNNRNNNGQGIDSIHQAAWLGNDRALQNFLRRGVSANAVIVDNQTPLHWVLMSIRFNGTSPGLLGVIQSLHQHNADLSKQDSFGNTPWTLVHHLNNNAVLDLFKDRVIRENNNDCPICQDDDNPLTRNNIVIMNQCCNYALCQGCFNTIATGGLRGGLGGQIINCPSCRSTAMFNNNNP